MRPKVNEGIGRSRSSALRFLQNLGLGRDITRSSWGACAATFSAARKKAPPDRLGGAKSAEDGKAPPCEGGPVRYSRNSKESHEKRAAHPPATAP